MDILEQYIVEHFGISVIVGIALCSALVLATVGVMNLIFKYRALKSRVDAMPCAGHESSLQTHSDRMSEMAGSLARIEGSLNALMLALPQLIPSSRGAMLSDDVPPLAQKHSPKRLNDNGRKVSQAFDCDKFLDDNQRWLVTEVEKFAPKTALDVELMSLAALRVASSDTRFNELKGMIYRSPAILLTSSTGDERPTEITLDDVLFVISLPLRDLYLQQHPEITL